MKSTIEAVKHRLFSEEGTERAVSPVIGVILMVAITVILAAVIGVFVLGIGDDLGSEQPSVTVGFTEAADDDLDGSGTAVVALEHSTGTTLDLNDDDYTVLVNGNTVEVAEWDYPDADTRELSAGETTLIDIDDAGVADEDQEVALRHEASDSILTTDTVEIKAD